MIDWISQPWPWWVSGPLIGLTVPLLLLVGGKRFGVSSSFRHTCAMASGGRGPEYFRYDWRRRGGWNLAFVLGMVGGGVLAATVFQSPDPLVQISDATVADLAEMGIEHTPGLVPAGIFGWESLGSLAGLVVLVGGGFLVGFGARWADGCTSGHAITGLATFQLPSLIAVLGFFAGGLFVTWVVYPLLFSGATP